MKEQLSGQPFEHRLFHRAYNILITGTTAQVAGHAHANFLIRKQTALIQNLHRAHDGARCTETALDGSFIDKGLLDVRELAVRTRQPFQGQNVLAVGPDSQINAVASVCSCCTFSVSICLWWR